MGITGSAHLCTEKRETLHDLYRLSYETYTHNSDVNVTPYLFKYIPRAQMQEDTFNCVRTLSGRLERERQT